MPRAIDRIKDEMSVWLAGDTINLCYCDLPTEKNRVNLNFFRSGIVKAERNQYDSGAKNLGDDIAPMLVEFLLKQKGISLRDETAKTTHLYAIGSILFMGHQNATVWGSGILTEPSRLRCFMHSRWFRTLDIRCVRGPYTRNVLQKNGHTCPPLYGDPGCLLPYMYKPQVKKTLDYLIIPHVSMEAAVRKVIPAENIASMATDDYKSVAEKICAAKKVIASSLHGIIFSEAYQVPTLFYQDRKDLYNFKYADWYEGTGRKSWKFATSLIDAIEMDPMPVPDLSATQQMLLEQFPYDLWNK